jgi:DNA-binding transcriptional regulator GbsR (MarR family)
MKTKDMKIKKAQGEKSRRLASQNLAKIYLKIAEKPLSFSELLTETGLSKPILMKHLRTLQKEQLIYKDTIKPTETSNPLEIGKIIYKVKEDEMENFLMQTIHMNFTIADLVEDENLKQKLNEYAKEIAKAIIQYINQLRASRKQNLKAELEKIQKK